MARPSNGGNWSTAYTNPEGGPSPLRQGAIDSSLSCLDGGGICGILP